jgi:hypothetical protein
MHKNRMYYPLNDEVRKIVTEDFELWLVFNGIFGAYDDDIDPLHNPDWVKLQKRNEYGLLEHARLRLIDLKDRFEAHRIANVQIDYSI